MSENDKTETCDPITRSIPATLELPDGATVEGAFMQEHYSDAYFVPARKNGESDEDWQARWEWIRVL